MRMGMSFTGRGMRMIYIEWWREVGIGKAEQGIVAEYGMTYYYCSLNK
jgi:hypothetical protein